MKDALACVLGTSARRRAGQQASEPHGLQQEEHLPLPSACPALSAIQREQISLPARTRSKSSRVPGKTRPSGRLPARQPKGGREQLTPGLAGAGAGAGPVPWPGAVQWAPMQQPGHGWRAAQQGTSGAHLSESCATSRAGVSRRGLQCRMGGCAGAGRDRAEGQIARITRASSPAAELVGPMGGGFSERRALRAAAAAAAPPPMAESSVCSGAPLRKGVARQVQVLHALVLGVRGEQGYRERAPQEVVSQQERGCQGW